MYFCVTQIMNLYPLQSIFPSSYPTQNVVFQLTFQCVFFCRATLMLVKLKLFEVLTKHLTVSVLIQAKVIYADILFSA